MYEEKRVLSKIEVLVVITLTAEDATPVHLSKRSGERKHRCGETVC